MKTNLTSKALLLVLFLAFTAVSCKKDESPVPGTGTSPSTTPTVNTTGQIVDYGVVNNDIRLMKTSIMAQDFTLTGADSSVNVVSAQVAASFYVNNDGSIPSGEYLFSSSQGKTPFTFDSGAILGALPANPYGGATQTDQIISGKITVQQNGDNYVFGVQVQLASGSVLDGSFTGRMDYADSK